MKTKSAFIISCCLIVGITSFAQNKISSPNTQLPKTRPWLLRGNSGTDTAVNFFGTTDSMPLVFKVNNQKAGYIGYNSYPDGNTAFGYQSLNFDIVAIYSGNNNSSFGYQSLFSNTAGSSNTAIGGYALYANTKGSGNTAIGGYSFYSNTTGSGTAIGEYSLYSNTTGTENTANGFTALYYNTKGFRNTANGSAALYFNTTGLENTAVGVYCLYNNATGSNNTANGYYALYRNRKGSDNTALGSFADVSQDNLYNATAIGSNSLVDASNKVRIGNESITSIGGQVGWTSFSDERIKSNIKENVPGLEFIKQLRPLTYHFNLAKENELMGRKDSTKWDSKYDIEKIQFTGFIAQEVDKAAKNISYDFSGVDKNGNIMGLRYSEFVVPLVKAVQELSQQNDNLKKEVDDLRSIVLTLQSQMKNINASQQQSQIIEAGNSARLEQNTPNPFNSNTIIRYYLPSNTEVAQIVISDASGHQVKTIFLNATGAGQTTITAGILAAGNYTYTLIVDRKKADSKQMVITR